MVELRTSTESMKGVPPPVPSAANLAWLGQKAAHMMKIDNRLSDGIDEEAEGGIDDEAEGGCVFDEEA